MRFLNIGDLHIEAKDLKTSAMNDFMRKIPEVAKEYKCEAAVFLGDLGHTHDVLNSFVQNFFNKTFGRRGLLGTYSFLNFFILIGNHDQASTTEPEIQSLSSIEMAENVRVIARPSSASELGAVILPYMHDNEEFVREAERLRIETGYETLICHQTFAGACYENKFLAAGGVDAARLGFKRIISGHIHMRQDFGVVHYTGTPRWKTAADYNEPKALSVFDTSTGQLEAIDCSRFWTPWRRYFEKQDSATLSQIPVRPETEVVIEGDNEFVAARSAYWSALGVRSRARVIGSKVTVSVNSGKAIGELLSEYVDKAELRGGSSREAIKSTLGAYL